MARPLRRLLPGLALLVVLGLAARTAASLLPFGNHLVLAVVLGAVVTNTYGQPSWAEPGVSTHKLLLETGIVLMGVRLALDAVLAAGPTILVLVVATVAFTLVLVEFLSRNLFGLADKIGSLIAAGAGICGVSAIVAVAGGIDADEDQIAYAVATILLFDALTLVAFPAAGQFLGLSDVVFGVWAGLSMFSTGPVAAAGFAYSETAGQWATLTKLTRNVLISVAVVGYSVFYARRQADAGSIDSRGRLVWDQFPKFVVGFVAMMVVANLGVLSQAQVAALQNGYRWLFLFAFVGLGLHIRVADMRSTGVRPVLLLLTTLLAVSTAALFAVRAFFSA